MKTRRPVFHYTAEQYTINDPNGLVYLDGEYHLMHQHNINEQIHWGHAVSKDLVHWARLPSALYPDEIGQVWSGSAVVDSHNTSGLQTGSTPLLIAVFTYCEHNTGVQSQGLAFSNDKGRTWQKYSKNPVLTSTQRDFRDPKIFWHKQRAQWCMVLACGDHVEFYSSPNLLEWKLSGSFGQGQGAPVGVWECPDLFELPISGTEERRWVLLISLNEGGPAGGTAIQYFIGSFDGEHFENENVADTILWLDWGRDFYAGATWNNLPDEDGRRLIIAWADNWQYRNDMPTGAFLGQQSVPRELTLFQTPLGVRIAQAPVRELPPAFCRPVAIEKQEDGLHTASEKAFYLHCRIETDRDACVRLQAPCGGSVALIYRSKEKRLLLDRTAAANVPNSLFASICEAPVNPYGTVLELTVFADTNLLEVFANRGETVLTCLAFPQEEGWQVAMSPADAFARCEVFAPDDTPFII